MNNDKLHFRWACALLLSIFCTYNWVSDWPHQMADMSRSLLASRGRMLESLHTKEGAFSKSNLDKVFYPKGEDRMDVPIVFTLGEDWILFDPKSGRIFEPGKGTDFMFSWVEKNDLSRWKVAYPDKSWRTAQ
jgi:hypothetical protein